MDLWHETWEHNGVGQAVKKWSYGVQKLVKIQKIT